MVFREVLVTQVMDVLRAWLAGRASVQRPGAGADVKTAPAVYPCGAGGRPGRWRVRHSWPANCPARYFQKPASRQSASQGGAHAPN